MAEERVFLYLSEQGRGKCVIMSEEAGKHIKCLLGNLAPCQQTLVSATSRVKARGRLDATLKSKPWVSPSLCSDSWLWRHDEN